VARYSSRYRVSRATPPVAASRRRPAHSWLPAGYFPRAAAELPVYPVLLPIRTRSGHPVRCAQGHLAGRLSSRPLSSISSGRVRPCPLTL
jgi:hypothetical protein